MYQLFCDSNCELWHTTAKELGLRVIRMPYVLDGKEYYYDLGEATDFAHFYQRMREGAVPTTSAINEQDYIDYFEPVLQEGQDIYYITFSHKMSATFQSMDRAIAGLLQKYSGRQIRIFDTKTILDRPASVMVSKTSGLAGIAYWINENYGLSGDAAIGKNDPLVKELKEWVDAEYENGRQNALGRSELEERIQELAPGRFVHQL